MNTNPKLTLNNNDSPGDFIFSVNQGTEMLRLCGNGDIMVKGRLAANDLEVIESFKEFLKIMKQEHRL